GDPGGRPRPAAGHARDVRDHAPGRDHAQPHRPRPRRGERPAPGRGLLPGVQPGARLVRPRVLRPRPLPQARRRDRRGERPPGRRVLRERPRLRRPRRPPASERGVGPRVGRGRRARQARRDHLPRREHRAGQPVRAVRAAHRRRLPPDRRGVQLPAVQLPAPPRHRGRRPLHPGVPVVLPGRGPVGDGRARGPRGERGHAGAVRGPPGRAVRRPGRRGRRGARRLLPGRGEGDGVLGCLRHGRGAAQARRPAAGRGPPAHRGGDHRARVRAVPPRHGRRRRGGAGRPRRVPAALARRPARREGGPRRARGPRPRALAGGGGGDPRPRSPMNRARCRPAGGGRYWPIHRRSIQGVAMVATTETSPAPHRGAATAVALLLALAASACGGAEPSPAPPAPTERGLPADKVDFCTGAVDLAGVVNDGPDVPDGPPPPSPEDVAAAFEEYQARLEPPLTAVEQSVPPALQQDIATIARQARYAVATNDEAPLGTPEYDTAVSRLRAYMITDCGFEQVRVTAVEYRFDGIPARLPAGTVAFTVSNQGAETHELDVYRINEGVP